MDNDLLNIWICENLMGFKRTPENDGSAKTWKNSSGTIYYGAPPSPFHCADSWEELKEKIVILGFYIEEVIACDQETNEINYLTNIQPIDEAGCYEPDNGFQDNDTVLWQTRYEAFKQAQPEIDKRLSNQ